MPTETTQTSKTDGGTSPLGWAWRVGRVILVPYCVILLLLLLLEERMIFPAGNFAKDNWDPDFLDYEDVNFAADDGTQLHGWYVPHPNPRAYVLFAHGNAGNLSHRGRRLEYFHQQELAVFGFDYRGYGNSQGKPNEQGIYQDARAARAWLANREQIPETEIVLLGTSLGGGVMVELAADGARGLILESTFDGLDDTAAHHYWYMPVRVLMRNRFRSVDKIAQYQGPLLQSHGKLDEVIPYTNGQRLFAAANEPKHWVSIPDGTHNVRPSAEYDRAFSAFFDQLNASTEKAAVGRDE